MIEIGSIFIVLFMCFYMFADEIVDKKFRLHFSFITAMCLTVLVVCPTYVIIHIIIN